MTTARAGEIIDLWDEGAIVSGVVLAEERGRLRVITENGDEVRVTASRIAHRAGRLAAMDASRAAEAALRHAAAARSKAEEVDVAALWDLLVDGGKRYGAAELAELALGDSSPESASALIRSLAAARTWFERKGDEWEAKPRETVEGTLRRQRIEQEKAARRQAFLAAARAIIRGHPAGPPIEEWEEHVRPLVDVAVHGDLHPDRKIAAGLLADLGDRSSPTWLAAFHLLVRLGVFREDEPLELRRFGLRTAFPPEVEEAAARAASSEPRGNRVRLEVDAFTLDDPETVEIDDALSWEDRGGGGGRLGVHIADPSSFIEAGDPVDAEALQRATTYYLADARLPMIPAALSERGASLVEGEARPALSYFFDVDDAGGVAPAEIVPSVLRSKRRLGYDEADAILEAPEAESSGDARAGQRRALASIARVADRLEAQRAAAGAILVRAPEVKIRVHGAGEVEIKRIDERGASRRIVAEMMILVNRRAADLFASLGLPAIYRRQAPPEKKLDPIPDGPYDPVAVRTLRRSLRRGEVTLAPEPHFALGAGAYLQITSPLRRYQDLVMQRQLEAHLAGEPLPYDAAALARIAATTEEAERSARAAETSRAEYWILKHYARRAGETVTATVVAAEPRRIEVELDDTLMIAAIAPRPGLAPGTRVSLIVEEARPREGVLRLRLEG